MSDCFQDLAAFYLVLDTAQGIIYNPPPPDSVNGDAQKQYSLV